MKERDMKIELDKKYQERIEAALTDALLKTAMSEDGSTCMLKSGEIGEALINIFAFVVHTSEAVSSSTKRRHVCDEIAKKLSRRIAAMQDAKAGETLRMQTVHLGDLH
jgi:hypothetical protein